MRPPFRLLLVVATTTIASCGGSTPTRPPAPAPPAAFGLTMNEFGYTSPQGPFPAGRVVFRLVNQGKQNHQPTFMTLAEDIPPILDQLRGDNRRRVRPIVNSNGLRPGVTGAIAVDLEPGVRYAFVCFAKTSDGKDHSRMGMAWEFRAEGAPVPPPPP